MALKSFWLRTTPLDRVVVIAALAVCAGLLFAIGLRPPGQSIQVMRNGDAIYRAPLDRDVKAELPGPLGTTHLEIHDGAARVVSSPCPYKVCISMGEISRQNEIIACVPNRLLVKVVGADAVDTAVDKESDYDLLSR